VSGVIERVRTGAKEPFQGMEAISGVIARMMEAEGVTPLATPRPPRTRRRGTPRRGSQPP
jgi:hypothetical protein